MIRLLIIPILIGLLGIGQYLTSPYALRIQPVSRRLFRTSLTVLLLSLAGYGLGIFGNHFFPGTPEPLSSNLLTILSNLMMVLGLLGSIVLVPFLIKQAFVR